MRFFAAFGALCALAMAPPPTRAVPDIGTLLQSQLPFTAQPHTFALSETLFGGGDGTTSDAPFPTGAFWTNLVLEQGESAVATLPYALRVLRGRVHVSHPFRVVMPTIIQNGFLSQLVLSSAGPDSNTESDGDAAAGAPLTHEVVAFDALSATVRFSRRQQPEFALRLVRGSPYITAEFAHARPTLEGFEGIAIARVRKLADQVLASGAPVDFAVFLVQLSTGQTWGVYASDPALELVLAGGRLTAAAPFTGTLRVALCLDAAAQLLLLEAAPFYPVGGAVDYVVDAAANVATVEFRWQTRRFAAPNASSAAEAAGDARDADKLLMLALPHHADLLAAHKAAGGVPANALAPELRFTSIKGVMTGVYGAVWRLRETLPAVEWDFARDGAFAAGREADSDAVTAAIVAQLAQDAAAFPVLAADSYNFGKQIAREARLLLIAERFAQHAVAAQVLRKMETALGAWLTGANADALVYDQTFGGVVTRDGLRDQDADYGNGRYNDHHFHYGYLIYALAAVRKADPAFIASHSLACALLVGDIGTPVRADTPFYAAVPAQQLFPVARHKEWFVGHSYASGLFSMEVGKAQESSSEAVNAYYALALFSSLDADAHDAGSYHQYARLLLATELRSAKTYWHMVPHSRIYEPLFARNAMVGVAGELSVVYSTWFGDRPVYVHGINMLPFTPVTTQLLDAAYVAHEYALLRPELDALGADDIWRGVVVLDQAILDAKAAWDELAASVCAYDTWNSATNAMYWIATRRSWGNASAVEGPQSATGDDQCFGFPACGTAGANGTALGCCATLPGCCPSALGCCPTDPKAAPVPLNACFGEHQCAVLGVACCNSIDGCCEPDPVTGAVLGCCKNQHPVTATPLVRTPPSNATASAVCFDQPLCAAAKLDCCASAPGCCASNGPKLGCCTAPHTAAATPTTQNETKTDNATCHHQPKCAAAKLDCCGAPEGCCQPDPDSGAKLLCCDDNAETVAPPPPPASSEPDYVRTCHGELACLTGGANGTALNCCFSEKGCCPGLLCCSTAAGSDGAGSDGDEARAKAGAGDSDAPSTVNLVVAIALGVFLVGTLALCLAMCYRRRHYAPIDHDLRAWYCAAMVVVVMGFFVFLVYSA
ncbi:hypothetical protein PybrP1_009232 [[Pythium] brassicae (nom. inval.)]|nr:hypothetical protein PybrP1_009232 [[Pythium] brassicae (nom. inval.)]